MRSKTHITKADRTQIEELINSGVPLNEIAEVLGRHTTTISREVRQNRVKIGPVAKSKFRYNPCEKRETCKVRHLCSAKNCNRRCAKCNFIFCDDRCEEFVQWVCNKTDFWPHVCNRCKWLNRCPEIRYSYDAARADRIANYRASNSRRGIDLDPHELEKLDAIVTPLIRKGQSIYHIWNTHRDEIDVCPSTLYAYLDDGLFDVKRIELPRAVHFKPRHKSRTKTEVRRAIGKRTYDDYLSYLSAMAKFYRTDIDNAYDDWDIECDTVIGRRGGKCLLTIVFVRSELFLARLLDKKTHECVIQAFDDLEKIFRRNVERRIGQDEYSVWWFFCSALTDNGTEMADFKSMERTVFKGRYEGQERMQVYYCDPYSSWQKPRIEVAHTLLRRVLPKGTSFDDLTQADINLICSHINSYTRENLGGATPFEVAPVGFCGDGIYRELGLSRIDPENVILKPSLLS
jgi:IS30 family transposase